MTKERKELIKAREGFLKWLWANYNNPINVKQSLRAWDKDHNFKEEDII